jgi:hypothetical protein
LFCEEEFSFEKGKNSYIQQQITSVKGDKTALQQKLFGLQEES